MIKKILLVTAVVFILNCIAVPFFGTVEQEPEPYSKVKSVIITYEYYGLDKGTVTLSIKDNGSYVRRDETRIMKSNGNEKTYKYFYLLTPENFYKVQHVTFTTYKETRIVGLWAFLGFLSTASHGYYAAASAPIWLFTGIYNASAESTSGVTDSDFVVWDEIRKYARFPQGIPQGVDLRRLKHKPYR